MLINGHSDILSEITRKRAAGEREVFRNHFYEDFRASQVNMAVFVIWVEPEYMDNPLARTEEFIEAMEADFKECEDIVNRVRSWEELSQVDPADERINIMLGFEGMHMLGGDLDLLADFDERLGLAYCSMTWNEKNDLATGMGQDQPGLSERGREAVRKMEDLAIVVDVSHLNEESFWDVVELAKKPIIASHSNARVLAETKRNLTDDQIRAIAKTGGTIGMNAFRSFVKEEPEERTIDGLIDHMDYIKDLVGVEHLAFGFDFCDFLPADLISRDPVTNSSTIRGLASERDVRDLIARMKERGYSQEEIELISYKNLFRVFEEVSR